MLENVEKARTNRIESKRRKQNISCDNVSTESNSKSQKMLAIISKPTNQTVEFRVPCTVCGAIYENNAKDSERKQKTITENNGKIGHKT